MRLLYVAAEAAFFVTHRLPLALAARERGYEVHVATPPGRLGEKIVERGFPWHPIAVQRRTNVIRELRSIPNLYRLYRRLRPDLVHHVAIKPVLYGTVAARLARVPAVINAVTGLGYGFDERQAKRLLGRTLGFAFDLLLRHPRSRFIFQNVEDRDTFLRRGWSTPEAAELIRGSGVDVERFAPAAAPPAGPPLVVLASRLLASKGVAEFAEAARILKSRGVDARFAIVGSPDLQNPDTVTDADLQRWRDSGAVELFGARTDMPDVLREASLFVLPTYYREGVPKALIEAGAAALPSITTDTPGCRDIVQHDVTGLLVPPRDAESLANAMQTLLEDANRRREMGRLARERVLKEFALEHVIAQTLAAYEKALAR
ncbi:MAG TPA: glycosyltransferase family 4 protein [Thermoanaerobaculia bacterium]|nr:glycosyltransferase family 4 protein [Thermoanaerobaculia bacterium]